MDHVAKYFDYLHEHGQYLTDRFELKSETDSLEADIAKYRRRRRDENTYWVPAVYLRKLLEQIVDGYLRSSAYVYSKELGRRIHDGISDGYIPRQLGHKMSALNELVREGAHAGDEPYSASDLEAAFIQLDIVLRSILQSDGQSVDVDEVTSGTDEVLLAHSDSIEEKGRQAALLLGNQKLAEESRAANKKAIDAEREARAARLQVEEITKENEQLKLDLAVAKQALEEQKVAFNEKAAAYAQNASDSDSVEQFFARIGARTDERAALLEFARAESDANLSKAEENYREKEAFADEVANKVSEMEEQLDAILNEHDFINRLLDAHGKATDEQRRIVNYPLNSNNKSRILRVLGKAGTGKTLCLLAAVINYLEPNRQGTLTYADDAVSRRALFVCYNKDLAKYIRGLLERFPYLYDRIEVASYDQFLNQLVRTRPIKDYEYLSGYAQDVRFCPVRDSNGVLHYWRLIVNRDEKRYFVRNAIVEIRNYYQHNLIFEHCDSSYLDENDDYNVEWLLDEIEWLEGRYHDAGEAQATYPGAERVGRGRTGRNPRKNSIDRQHVLEIWKAYCFLLQDRQCYTLQQIVTMLLRSKCLPAYDIVAIDEAQDLNILHIELFTRFMKERGYLLIAGDEDQRVYPRDFSWKEVDSRLRSLTRTLSVNKRNPVEIRLFAERLKGDKYSVSEIGNENGRAVRIVSESKRTTVEYVKELAGHRDETTVVVASDAEAWTRLLRDVGISTETSKDWKTEDATIRMQNGGVRPGVYCFTQLKAKGLEFDNVIIDYAQEIDKWDEQRERRIRYMQFTRARKTLLVRYEGEPPQLLKKCYSDYLTLHQ